LTQLQNPRIKLFQEDLQHL